MSTRADLDTMYFKDKEALSIPWIESPFFNELLKSSSFTDEEILLAKDYNENGYTILDLELTDIEINSIISDVYKYVKNNSATLQADHFQYNESPRVFEGWKESRNIRNLALNEKIFSTLKFLYQKEPFPFSTINFIRGSNQPLHSDSIHFHTIPNLWMVGVWVALEDTNKMNGALRIVPGSHKWSTYDYSHLKLPHPDKIEDGEAVNYRQYEDFIKQLIKAHSAEEYVAELKKGQALIWTSNMLHGGIPVVDEKSTRQSQAIHYFFGGCEKYFHPMFSDPYNGEYAEKWCDEQKNIKTWKT